jgi:hypothetical protein
MDGGGGGWPGVGASIADQSPPGRPAALIAGLTQLAWTIDNERDSLLPLNVRAGQSTVLGKDPEHWEMAQ